MWAGIIATPPALAWYLTAAQNFASSLRASPNSVWPSIFSGLAILCFVVMLLANAVAHSRWERLFNRQAATQRDTTTANPPQFRNVDEFYRLYSMRMLTETEVAVRAESDQYQPGTDRERYLVRVVAMLVTVLIFEKVWLMIFGSQLKALQQLNIGMLTYEEIRRYYDDAAKGSPDFYKNVAFEMWLGFLKSWLLIREHDLTHLEITIRGQDFLRYLVESRYDPATRIA
jgi:hypothetical protein